MPSSTIDVSQPANGAAIASAPVRNNFAAASNDINAIYALIAAIGNGTMAIQNANNVTISGGSINGTTVGASSPSTGSFTNLTISGTFSPVANSITAAMQSTMATARFKGRTTAGTGNEEDLTATQATALLNNLVGDSGSGGTKGLAPAPAAGDAAASKFLKADGTWSTPAGAGTVTGPVSSTSNAVSRFSGTGGQTLKNSGVVIDDSNNVTGVAQLTATTVVAALTGNVTGNASGSSGSCTGNAATATLASTVTTNANLTGGVTSVGNAATVVTNANLTGPVTSVGNATTISAAVVTEAMQTLSDVTTANVSTTKHGYAPKAPNDATKYLDGTGAYSVPAGSATGTVTTVSVTTANGVSGIVANPTTTPAITVSLAAITPTTVTASSTVQGTQLISTVATGTAPLTVASTTAVTNLKADTVVTNANLTGGVTSVGNSATVITNANLTGVITSVGNATSIASQTGTGTKFVVDTSPVLVTPNIGTPSAGVLTNCTGLPYAGGGTGAASFTQHGVVTAGATALTTVAPGSNGNVLTSNGTDWTSAAAAGGGELILLATATASASSVLNFTSAITSSYSKYVLVFSNIICSASSRPSISFSTDNGSTYAVAVVSARNQYTCSAGVFTPQSGGTGPVFFSDNGHTAFAGFAEFVINASAPYLMWRGSFVDGDVNDFTDSWIASTASTVNAFQLALSAGNFTSGKVYLYGVKNT